MGRESISRKAAVTKRSKMQMRNREKKWLYSICHCCQSSCKTTSITAVFPIWTEYKIARLTSNHRVAKNAVWMFCASLFCILGIVTILVSPLLAIHNHNFIYNHIWVGVSFFLIGVKNLHLKGNIPLQKFSPAL